MPALGVRCFVAQLPAGRAAEEVVDRLNADARVEWAQPMFQYRVLGHNDPTMACRRPRRFCGWTSCTRCDRKGVRIAEIDTGVDLRHPDLQGQVVDVQNFVDGNSYAAEVHGTAIAGIIVAKADNGIGIVGVAPGVLLSLRACWQPSDATSAVCSSFTLAKAMQYALRHGAQGDKPEPDRSARPAARAPDRSLRSARGSQWWRQPTPTLRQAVSRLLPARHRGGRARRPAAAAGVLYSRRASKY